MPTGIYKRTEEHSKAISKALMGHPKWSNGVPPKYGRGICHGCGIRPYIYESYKCKECSRELAKSIYHKNPQKIITYNRKINDYTMRQV